MDGTDVVYLLMVLVGIGLVVGGTVATDGMDTGGYYLVITDEATTEDEIADDSTVVAYDNLTPELQHAFREALEAEDRQYEFDETGPHDFESGMTVQYQGRYYELGQVIGTNNYWLASLLSIWGPPAGIVIGTIGIFKFWRREEARNE